MTDAFLVLAIALLSWLSGACLAVGLVRTRGASVTAHEIADSVRAAFNEVKRER